MADGIDYNISASEPIVDKDGKPTLKFQRKWQKIIERIKALEP